MADHRAREAGERRELAELAARLERRDLSPARASGSGGERRDARRHRPGRRPGPLIRATAPGRRVLARGRRRAEDAGRVSSEIVSAVSDVAVGAELQAVLVSETHDAALRVTEAVRGTPPRPRPPPSRRRGPQPCRRGPRRRRGRRPHDGRRPRGPTAGDDVRDGRADRALARDLRPGQRRSPRSPTRPTSSPSTPPSRPPAAATAGLRRRRRRGAQARREVGDAARSIAQSVSVIDNLTGQAGEAVREAADRTEPAPARSPSPARRSSASTRPSPTWSTACSGSPSSAGRVAEDSDAVRTRMDEAARLTEGVVGEHRGGLGHGRADRLGRAVMADRPARAGRPPPSSRNSSCSSRSISPSPPDTWKSPS